MGRSPFVYSTSKVFVIDQGGVYSWDDSCHTVATTAFGSDRQNSTACRASSMVVELKTGSRISTARAIHTLIAVRVVARALPFEAAHDAVDLDRNRERAPVRDEQIIGPTVVRADEREEERGAGESATAPSSASTKHGSLGVDLLGSAQATARRGG